MARAHLSALQRVGAPHTLVAVCDVVADAASELGASAGAVAYTSLPELLRRERPDVVHVCTPAGTHFEPAREALLAGAHVYVEKPFVETEREAAELLDLAAARSRLVCAGHQQLRDRAYVRLSRRVRELGKVALVDCQFTFRPPGLDPDAGAPTTLGGQLLDVLPHPLYTLVAMLEQVTARPGDIEIASLVAGPADLHAVLRSNGAYGRLALSLRARPIASTLSVSGSGGALTADFIRTSVVGAANSGTGPLEKMLNPLLEAGQTAVRASSGIARRIVSGDAYPGLAELIGDFYQAVAEGRASPVAPEHLRRVTALYEELAANVHAAAERAAIQLPSVEPPAPHAPLAVLTGARGFFGSAIARELARRGFRVRGISRAADAANPHVHEWVRLDLGRAIAPEAFAGADVVVHAAAETAGGFAEHQRNTIDATSHVLQAMHAAHVQRLVYVSSLSVLRPPRTPWERQDERTPLVARNARQYGAYTWGKAEAERLVGREAPELGIEVRMLRPAALVDWAKPDVPGLAGRQLFGRWHLGFGRPRLPFAVCEVGRAAAVVAWCASAFGDAPRVVNLMEPEISTRAALLEGFRARGWRGRVMWMPIPLFAALFGAARGAIALARLRLPRRMAVWSVFRPRRYDTPVAAAALAAAERRATTQRSVVLFP